MKVSFGWTPGTNKKNVRAGDVLKGNDDPEEIILVGDVNDLGGICNHCTYSDDEAEQYELLGNILDNPELIQKVKGRK